MAMQVGTRLVFLAGAGFVGSVLIKNNKLGEFIGDITKVLSKHLKERKDVEGGGSESALRVQVQQLTKELRSLVSSSRTTELTVVQGGSSGSIATFIFPVAVVGVISYACMKWRGYSFSDLMYVTKKGMSDAVGLMGKQLEQVSGALSATRKHMNQRLDTVDGKLDDSIVMTGLVKEQVEEVKGIVGRTIYEIENVNKRIEGLGVKIDEVQESQSFANQGIFLLIEWVHRLNVVQHPELQQSFKNWYLKAEKTSSFAIPSPGLKQLFSESLELPNINLLETAPVRLLETAPVRNTGNLNLPSSPGLGFSSNNLSTDKSQRTFSASIVSRSSLNCALAR